MELEKPEIYLDINEYAPLPGLEMEALTNHGKRRAKIPHDAGISSLCLYVFTDATHPMQNINANNSFQYWRYLNPEYMDKMMYCYVAPEVKKRNTERAKMESETKKISYRIDNFFRNSPDVAFVYLFALLVLLVLLIVAGALIK